MVNLNEFIQIIDNSIDNETCNFLIDVFATHSGYAEPMMETESGYFLEELNLTSLRTLDENINEVQKVLIQKVYEHREHYYNLFDSNIFPDSHAFEHFKIQKFQSNEIEHFYTKVDVKEYTSARRFLGFTWFLNDNPAGQYEFLDLFVQPHPGRVIIHPPFWMFPKKKYIPVNEPQYILTTYLHYK